METTRVAVSESDLISYLSSTFALDVDADEPLFSSALLDSMNLVEVVAFLESRTGVVVESDDLTRNSKGSPVATSLTSVTRQAAGTIHSTCPRLPVFAATETQAVAVPGWLSASTTITAASWITG